MKQLFFVGLGGALGAIFRYLASVVTSKYYIGNFPLATFLVNISGCFLIGVLIGGLSSSSQNSNDLRLLFVTGFCGAYTTFSTFAAENLTLIEHGNSRIALLYILLSIILGVLAVWLGVKSHHAFTTC
jgi:CrcB protein